MKATTLQVKPRTLRLRFNETPEDQALYDALCRTSEKEFRTSLPRHGKHLLRMALGLREADVWLLHRIGVLEEDPDILTTKACEAVAAREWERKQTKPDLRLV